MDKPVDIKGLDKADVLAALYNASRPLGMGMLQYDPNPMTREEATEHLATQDTPDYIMPRRGMYFDYLKGRVMKVNLEGEQFDAWGYDRDNGDGAAERAIAPLRSKAAEAA